VVVITDMNIVSNIKSQIIPSVQSTNYIIGSDLLDNLYRTIVIRKKAFSSFLVLSDGIVFNLYGQKIVRALQKLGKPIVISLIPVGEQSKNIALLPEIIKPYFQHNFDRKSCLIALGGGVVTDLGGFLASILLRGISFINIPTTLLGQVDAAIGGKSGVDFWFSKNQMYKNMIGVINQPSLVISDVETLKTLPEREILNGLGEIVKYWVGWSKPTLKQLLTIKTPEKWLKDSFQVEEFAKTISICQRIKLNVVTKDPFEKSGERQKLNLGHTVGHALESAAKGELSHGEAVAIGLIAAAKISVLTKMLSNSTYKLIWETIKSLNLPVIIKGINREEVLKAMEYDKKGNTFVLIKDIGIINTGCQVPINIINQALKEIVL